MELTEEQKAQYLAEGGTKCPYCRSKELDTGTFEADHEGAWQWTVCIDCGKEWRDNYTLADITEAE